MRAVINAFLEVMMTTLSDTLDDLLTTEEVARILRIDEVTLKRWRMDNRGPRWVKMGDAQNSPVRYARSEVTAFIQRRTEGEVSP